MLDNRFFSGREWTFGGGITHNEADFRVDMIRDGALDDEPHLAPRFTPPSVQHNDCPDCGSVAGKLCRDWTACPVTGEWRGTGYVIEGAHRGRLVGVGVAA